MDEVEQRLRDGADICVKSYEAWRKNEKDNAIRATLQDAVHELRKIASRIEIELAVSERNEMAQKPIPIPPHRDARGRHQSAPHDGGDDDFGNAEPQQNHQPRPPRHGGHGHSGGGRRLRSGGGGGGGHQGGPRRDSSEDSEGNG